MFLLPQAACFRGAIIPPSFNLERSSDARGIPDSRLVLMGVVMSFVTWGLVFGTLHSLASFPKRVLEVNNVNACVLENSSQSEVWQCLRTSICKPESRVLLTSRRCDVWNRLHSIGAFLEIPISFYRFATPSRFLSS